MATTDLDANRKRNKDIAIAFIILTLGLLFASYMKRMDLQYAEQISLLRNQFNTLPIQIINKP